MPVSILNDYHDTLRTLDCFQKLDGHEVQVWNDHVQDVDLLAWEDGPAVLVGRAFSLPAGFPASRGDLVA